MRTFVARFLLAASYLWVGGLFVLWAIGMASIALSAPDLPAALGRIGEQLSPFNLAYYATMFALLLPAYGARTLGQRLLPTGTDSRLPKRYIVAPIVLLLVVVSAVVANANRETLAFVMAGEDRAQLTNEATQLIARVNEAGIIAERTLQASRVECCARDTYLAAWRARLAEWAERKQYRVSQLHGMTVSSLVRSDDGFYRLHAVETWSADSYRDGRLVQSRPQHDVGQTYVFRRIAGRLWIVDQYFD